jgi:hypothetical protein
MHARRCCEDGRHAAARSYNNSAPTVRRAPTVRVRHGGCSAGDVSNKGMKRTDEAVIG